jgi:MFS family permease
MPHVRIGVLGLITIAAYGCWHYAFGVLLDPILDDTGWSEPIVTAAFGASALIGGVGAMFGGWLLDRLGSRVVFVAAGAVGAGAFTVAAGADSAWVFAVSAAIGGGAFSALGFYHVTQTVAVRLTPGSTNRAIAVLTIWGAFASAVYIPASAFLVGRIGWRLTLVTLVASAVVTFVIGAVAIDTRTGTMPGGHQLVSELRASMAQRAARRLLLTQGLVGLAVTVVLVYQVPAMTSAGLPLAAASFWAGFRGLSQLLGRVPLMPIVDRLGVARSLRVAYVAIGLGTIALAFAGTPLLAAVYAVLAGFGIGATSPLIGMLSRDVFGVSSLGTAMGTVNFVFLVAGSVAPPIAGWASAATGSRVVPVAVSGAVTLVAAALVAAPAATSRPAR